MKPGNKIKLSLFLIFAGILIVALPDSDKRLFTLSTLHGPSLQDVIGLVVLLFGYFWLIIEAWKRKTKLIQFFHSNSFRTSFFLLGAGFGLILASVFNDFKHWWVIGIILAAGIQCVVFYRILK